MRMLKEHFVYRIAYNVDELKLRGRAVVFRGFRQAPGDIQRAIVCLMNADGSSGEEWWLNPALVIEL